MTSVNSPLTAELCSSRTFHLPWQWASMMTAALLALLGTELLVLSVVFDTWRLDALSSVSARLVAESPQAVRLALAMGVAALFFGSLRGVDWFRTTPRAATGRRLGALAVHAGAIGTFAWVTALLLQGDVAALQHRGAWTIAWLASGAAAIVSWAVALFPAVAWRNEVHAHRRHLAAGMLAGGGVWAAGYVTQEFWRPMARATLGVVASLLQLVYGQTVVESTSLRVGTPQFSVLIAPSCSGYEGIGLVVTFLSIYLWLFRRELRFPAALALLPLGAAAIWIANALRLVLLIVIGTSGWPGVALGGFHSQAGWIAFSLISLGLVAVALRARWFAAERAVHHVGPRFADATVAQLAPFVAVTATAMVTGAFASGTDWLYPLRIVAAVVVLWTFRSNYAALVRSWSWSWWPVLLGAVTFSVWIGLSPTESGAGGWAGVASSAPLLWVGLWAAFRGIGYVLVTPVVEELAFRAFLVQRLERSPIGRFSWAALLISSVLFGALHGPMWPAGILAGVAFSVAFYRRRMIADAVMAHGVTNALLVVYASTTRQWGAWS